MVIVKKLAGQVVGLAVLAAIGVAAYNILLSDEARESLRQGAASVKKACNKVCDTINACQGTVVDDDLPNRERTQRQWESIGY